MEPRRARDRYIPLPVRMSKWWQSGQDESGTVPAASDLEISVDQDLRDTFKDWSPGRIALCEAIWGKGFIGPSENGFVRKILAPARINARKSVLDLNAGLCGTSLMMVRETGAWIDALEPNESLVKHARVFVASNPLGRQIDLRHADFGTLEINPARYHLIFSRESLFATRFKRRLLEQIGRGLRNDGQFIFSDYVLQGGSGNSEAADGWTSTEPDTVYPWTLADYRSAMSENGLAAVSVENLTSSIVPIINAAWHRLMRNIQKGTLEREVVDHIMFEGEIWLNRIKAMNSGSLRLVRIHAKKSAKPIPCVEKEIVEI